MLKDCIFLRSLNVKYCHDNEPTNSLVLEHLFQPSTPMLPLPPPIYGAFAVLIPSDGIFALKICERFVFSMPITVAPDLETRLAIFQHAALNCKNHQREFRK